MNISKNSKENESLIIKSKTLKNSIKLKPSLNTKFFSIATHASTFTNQANMESKRYRKTISYLRSPSFVDLVNQTNLVDNKVIKFNKNYLINLIKIKMKKNKSKLPTIQTLSTFSPNTEVNFRTFSIDFNTSRFVSPLVNGFALTSIVELVNVVVTGVNSKLSHNSSYISAIVIVSVS